MNRNALRGARIIPATLLALATAAPLHADWSGKGELGLVVARGNSDSETFNGRVGLDYTRERWTNESNLSYLRSAESGETTAARFVIDNKTDYALSERRYVLGALRYDRDRFSSFRYQGSASLGYGYRVLDGERHFLKLEAGPGVRFSEERDSDDSETELIGRGYVEYRWIVSDSTEFSNQLLAESGADNTFLENQTALQVAINSRLALKTGVSVRHNTNVNPGRDKTDTLTTMNLVYKF